MKTSEMWCGELEYTVRVGFESTRSSHSHRAVRQGVLKNITTTSRMYHKTSSSNYASIRILLEYKTQINLIVYILRLGSTTCKIIV